MKIKDQLLFQSNNLFLYLLIVGCSGSKKTHPELNNFNKVEISFDSNQVIFGMHVNEIKNKYKNISIQDIQSIRINKNCYNYFELVYIKEKEAFVKKINFYFFDSLLIGVNFTKPIFSEKKQIITINNIECLLPISNSFDTVIYSNSFIYGYTIDSLHNEINIDAWIRNDTIFKSNCWQYLPRRS